MVFRKKQCKFNRELNRSECQLFSGHVNKGTLIKVGIIRLANKVLK
ncbi:Uncharacterised protein [Porphyromonas macacae]|uniref:Uncharacterized protein n=1 Tax=Porphyromonas macacae TaxID=28115 RepID=A0A379DEQ9_9PORP|nr:Uncharacterised protein [Porphyromonas macacae]